MCSPENPGTYALTEFGNAMHLPKLIGTTCSSENPSTMRPQKSAMPSTYSKSSSRPSARRTRYCQVLAASFSATDPEHPTVPRTQSIPCTRRTYQRQAPAELIRVELSPASADLTKPFAELTKLMQNSLLLTAQPSTKVTAPVHAELLKLLAELIRAQPLLQAEFISSKSLQDLSKRLQTSSGLCPRRF